MLPVAGDGDRTLRMRLYLEAYELSPARSAGVAELIQLVGVGEPRRARPVTSHWHRGRRLRCRGEKAIEQRLPDDVFQLSRLVLCRDEESNTTLGNHRQLRGEPLDVPTMLE